MARPAGLAHAIGLCSYRCAHSARRLCVRHPGGGMDLVDIAYTPKERKEEAAEMASGKYKGPEYPYGLSTTLNEETLAKVGIEELPRVGDEMRIEAVAKVTSVSMRSDKS